MAYWLGLLPCMAYPHLLLLCAFDVGLLAGWCNILSDWNIARLLSLVQLRGKYEHHINIKVERNSWLELASQIFKKSWT